MASYRSVTWTDDEDLTAQKLNQMTSNEQFLLERSIPMVYRAHGRTKNLGLKIASGVATLPATNTEMSSATVHFNGFFSVGCNPVVLATPACGHNHQVELAIQGHGLHNTHPNEQGFIAYLTARDVWGRATRYTNYVHWLAVGY